LNHEPLIRMANQIARAFAAQSPEAAVASTATHIRLFWDPRMRKGLREILATGGEGLDPMARAAAERLAQEAPAG
jgi:formate dehydrogenase subunit delta